ncbi:hypothetical protein C8R44DRAFT_983809 [Mycena epipterygia]|nr:hypothetical protein C8R44DRAFT_983809 [Mycena epipterygia]
MSRPDPLLLADTLQAFPLPPTFIPVSPAATSFPNPPPSRPPASPLPPVPGPSRISETDTLLFLQSTSTRSRRSSKLSLNNNRDSFASTRSDDLLSVLSTSTSSQRSSPRTPSSAAQSLHRPSLAFSIDEHAETPDDLLDGPPLQDLQKAPLDDDDLAHVPPVMPVRTSARNSNSRSTPPRTAPHRESIALSSVDIPIPDSDTEPDFDALEPRELDFGPLDAPDSRAASPDIATILATTPRPRMTSLSHRPPGLPYDVPWEEDFIDDYGQVRNSVYSVASKASGPYAFGYPDPDDPDAQSVDGEGDHLWDEPNESDSDLDLHTSLPQLMLHHGFLSPRSKLLPKTAGASASPVPPSPASSVFAGADAPPRDTRDTPKRRVRHRDGKTLRGGIGLTTGLGWSDSEDEDAPSALTRRISSLNLHRSGSQFSHSRASSLRSSAYTHSSAYSRSTSRVRRTQSECEDVDIEVDEFGTWKGGPPPTSWARRSEPTARLSRVQSQSSLAPRITRTPSMRTDDSAHTTHTATSTTSLPLMRSRSRVLRVMMADKEKPLPRTPSLRRNPSTMANMPSGLRPRATTGVSASALPKPHATTTPMTATTPLSMQSTPQPGLPPASTATSPPMPKMRPLRLQPRQPVLGGDRAPVPVPAVLNVGGLAASTTASSLASSATASSLASSISASTSATSVSLLSPSPSLSLAQPSPYARAPPSSGFAPPPSPGFVPPMTPTTPLYDQQTGIARPRPRTGTGMVYRTSSYGGVGVGGAPRGLPVRAPGKAVAL